MPPKEKKPAPSGEEEEPMEEDKELLEKELVISYLKMKLVAYQDQGEKLQVKNLHLCQELENSKLNLKDINEFLTNELKARALSSAALEHRKRELEQELAEQKAAYEERLARLTSEHEAFVEGLLEKMADSDRQARAASEYLAKKEELLQELSELRELLKITKREYEEKISEIERQHVQERDKWKRTMHIRIQNTKQFMMKLTDNQLEMTTKRTIMENEQMSAEMAYQGRQTNKVLARNAILEAQKAEMKRALALSRDTENELAKRNTIYQNTICQLLTKLKIRDEMDEDERKRVKELDKRMEDLEDHVQISKLGIDDKDAQLETLREELIRRDLEVASMKATIDESAQFLLRCMQDVKEKVVTIVPQNEEGQNASISVLPGKLDELSLAQRERALEYLLQKLHLFQGTDRDIIGIARPTTSADHIVLPPLQAARPPPLKPVTIVPSWPPDRDQGDASPAGASNLSVSVSTQTASPGLQPADQLLGKVLSEVRPWGAKAPNHPLAVSPKHNAPSDRLAPGSRGAAAAGAATPLSQVGFRGASHFKQAEPPLPGPYRQIAT